MPFSYQFNVHSSIHCIRKWCNCCCHYWYYRIKDCYTNGLKRLHFTMQNAVQLSITCAHRRLQLFIKWSEWWSRWTKSKRNFSYRKILLCSIHLNFQVQKLLPLIVMGSASERKKKYCTKHTKNAKPISYLKWKFQIMLKSPQKIHN